MTGFDSSHYVPVLKLKDGEKRALPRLPTHIRARVTPLFEVVERQKDKRDMQTHLDRAFHGLGDAVGSRRYFLDCREIETEGPDDVSEAFRRATAVGVAFTPVTGITRSSEVQLVAVRSRVGSIAIRLTRDEFESGIIPDDLPRFVTMHGLSLETTDLIIDLGDVCDMISKGVQDLALAFLSDVPAHQRWHTLTVVSSAFPFRGPSARSHDLPDRTDWLAWRDGLRCNRTIARVPTFGDAGIQHPRGVEGFDFRVMPLSATIRYSQRENWLRMKGADIKDGSGAAQYRDLATSLVYGKLAEYYCGPEHCAGCRDVKNAADGEGRYGSLSPWRRIGAIHHMALTVEQLDELGAA